MSQMRDRTAEEADRLFQTAMESEYSRLQFISNRDGLEGAQEFATRGVKIYGEAINAPVTQPNMARSGPHRYKFIASVLAYEEYLGLIEKRN